MPRVFFFFHSENLCLNQALEIFGRARILKLGTEQVTQNLGENQEANLKKFSEKVVLQHRCSKMLQMLTVFKGLHLPCVDYLNHPNIQRQTQLKVNRNCDCKSEGGITLACNKPKCLNTFLYADLKTSKFINCAKRNRNSHPIRLI